MSEIKTIKLGEDEFQFVNYSGNTRHGFYHASELFKNGCSISENKVNYLNRTWECYRYQTSMRGCVQKKIDSIKQSIESKFRRENNISRMTAKKREELEKLYDEDALISAYEKLYDALR